MHQKPKAEAGKNLAQGNDRNNRWCLGSMTFNTFPNRASFMSMSPRQPPQSPMLTAPCAWGLTFWGHHLEIVHFVFEFAFLKWSLMRQWSMCVWCFGPQRRPISTHLPQVGFQTPTLPPPGASGHSHPPFLPYPRTPASFWPLLEPRHRKNHTILGQGMVVAFPSWATLSRQFGGGG